MTTKTKKNTTKSRYSVTRFIKKFRAIPLELWTTGDYVRGDKCCVLGHCGFRNPDSKGTKVVTKEGQALCKLFSKYNVNGPATINDVDCFAAYSSINKNINTFSSRIFGRNPKERILTILENIKALENE